MHSTYCTHKMAEECRCMSKRPGRLSTGRRFPVADGTVHAKFPRPQTHNRPIFRAIFSSYPRTHHPALKNPLTLLGSLPPELPRCTICVLTNLFFCPQRSIGRHSELNRLPNFRQPSSVHPIQCCCSADTNCYDLCRPLKIINNGCHSCRQGDLL